MTTVSFIATLFTVFCTGVNFMGLMVHPTAWNGSALALTSVFSVMNATMLYRRIS